MRVLDLLEIISEYTQVRIYFALTNDLLSVYDGKNDIEKKYNGCFVRSINAGNNAINIFI